jgi:hypothetical protein
MIRSRVGLLFVGLALLSAACAGSEKENKRQAESLLPLGAEVVRESDCGDGSITDCYLLRFRHPATSAEELASIIRTAAESDGWVVGEDCGGNGSVCFYLRKSQFLGQVHVGVERADPPCQIRSACDTYVRVEGR